MRATTKLGGGVSGPHSTNIRRLCKVSGSRLCWFSARFLIVAFLFCVLGFRAFFILSSRIFIAMETSALKQQVHWTTANLVPEALQHRLYVVEDPTLIALLGRTKFVDMVVFGALGWQPGVSHSIVIILSCS